MKSTIAIMQKTIDAVFEGFALDDKGRLVETDPKKVAESDAHFKKYFLEFARDMWDEAELAAGGVDAGINNIEFQQAEANPAKMTFDVPTHSPSPHADEMPDEPGLNTPQGGMPGQQRPLSAEGLPGEVPPMHESDDLDALFSDIPDPVLSEIFDVDNNQLNELRELGPEEDLYTQGGMEEPGYGDQGGMEGQLDQGMSPMSHTMGGDLGAMGMDGSSMEDAAGPGDGDVGMASPGNAPMGDETIGLNGPQGGMDFDFDLDTLGFEFGEPGDEPGSLDDEGGHIGDDFGGEEIPDAEGPVAQSSDALDGSPEFASGQGMSTMDEAIRVPRQKKAAVVPAGKPKAKSARPGSPAKDWS